MPTKPYEYYVRVCIYCDEIFKASSRGSKVCDKCKEKKKVRRFGYKQKEVINEPTIKNNLNPNIRDGDISNIKICSI